MNMSSIPKTDALDILCPMHLRLGPTGHITHVGPTLRKLRGDAAWIGERFLEVFWMQRPRNVFGLKDLQKALGKKISLELRDAPRTKLKGVILPGQRKGEYIVNMAFGLSISEDISRLSLTNADFAPTDMTMELLYLLEAYGSVRRASQDLNARLEEAKERAERQASTDTLTGLQNRRAMETAVAHMVSAGTPMTLMQVDLDHFKAVNDTLGHAAGDHVLIEVANGFRDLLRSEDLAARFGGDEFVVALPEIVDPKVIKAIGNRLLARFEEPMEFNGNPCQISASIGAVSWDGQSPTGMDTLLDDADIALYVSKNAGRAQITLYEPHLREEAQTDEQTGRSVELWG